jgi:hypothetical protein
MPSSKLVLFPDSRSLCYNKDGDIKMAPNDALLKRSVDLKICCRREPRQEPGAVRPSGQSRRGLARFGVRAPF